MKGTQKTVHDGLILLAGKVADGLYGKNDAAFSQDEDAGRVRSDREAFCDDYEKHVLYKMN